MCLFAGSCNFSFGENVLMLEKINSPEDVKGLSQQEKKLLAAEIRNRLVSVVLENGGHLASNLGVTELTIALYSIVDPYTDKIIWDVGHQCYVHKLLTGRNGRFDSLRKIDGLSGFPKRNESKADCFETGHSSTSVSAAIGMARARDIKGQKYKVVAVIGDGAFTNGMVYEALNDAGRMFGSVVFLLNDNGMSISRNVGGMSKYLGKIRTGKSYIRIKKNIKYVIGKIPLIGKFLVRKIQMLKAAFRILTIPGEWFEELGIKYIGPVDGHNIPEIEKALNKAFYMNRPVLLHVITQKGHGYAQAEANPSAYHGVSPHSNKKNTGQSYSAVMAEELCLMAEQDRDFIAITAAMPSGTGLEKFGLQYPERFFDVGIAEEHAITMAAGMAAAQMKPYIAIYSTFMQRAYDQLLHDCALQKLHVVITLDRAGISGRDGRTHHGIYDIAFLNSIPEISVCAPCCAEELKEMLRISAEPSIEGPFIIRYPAMDNFSGDLATILKHPVIYGKGAVIYETQEFSAFYNVLILSFGQITDSCIRAAEILRKKCNVTIFHARFLKPLDEAGILNCIEEKQPDVIFTAEDGILDGGFGSRIAMLMERESIPQQFEAIGVSAEPLEHGSIEELYQKVKIDPAGIAERILNAIEKKKGRENQA